MARTIIGQYVAGLVALILGLSTAQARGGADLFTISLEQPVSNGVPGPGAGNIERPGAVDTYQLTITEPTNVYFEETSGGCGIVWSCVGPGLTPVFTSNAICVTDPGTKLLPEAGTYTITVTSTNSAGTYGFTVWALNPPETFGIGLEQTVSSGVPAAGAGFLEEPGAIDRYELSVTAPQAIYADELGGGCTILWKCTAPSGAPVFGSQAICVTDPGPIVLAESGTYVFEVSGSNGATGAYSFRIWSLEAPQVFPIAVGDTVSSGVPGPGAGVIEEPGSIDRYQLSIALPTNVYFDEIVGGCSILWSCTSPVGNALFSNNAICVTDPGQYLLLDTGTYTIDVHSGNSSATGAYSFKLVEVEPPQVFPITIGTTVSDGVPGPGAGNIEAPASVDIYLVEGGIGEAVCFLDGSGGCALRWRVVAPGGSLLFDDPALCVDDPGTFILPATGTYQVVVYGSGSATGTYSIAVLPSRTADLDGDCHVTAPDLAILLGAWGSCGAPCPADLNGDGAVDATDLATLLGEWD